MRGPAVRAGPAVSGTVLAPAAVPVVDALQGLGAPRGGSRDTARRVTGAVPGSDGIRAPEGSGAGDEADGTEGLRPDRARGVLLHGRRPGRRPPAHPAPSGRPRGQGRIAST
ncbi:predicted protein [Streptomyces viridosporus ATCC 14672]|uniref:Predicted protein n=1 Tax=Streptomyces viridosporus (strain ATCC 14672 / DSM 40746 / JCM 4963 / KCTC 9882 / NRRL B-12104 / FH 1290) TaxID=566461 RepID=D5ZX72_STRV1|nr:predicted protein [Streptomyces viridosporus ATCC 14672]